MFVRAASTAALIFPRSPAAAVISSCSLRSIGSPSRSRTCSTGRPSPCATSCTATDTLALAGLNRISSTCPGLTASCKRRWSSSTKRDENSPVLMLGKCLLANAVKSSKPFVACQFSPTNCMKAFVYARRDAMDSALADHAPVSSLPRLISLTHRVNRLAIPCGSPLRVAASRDTEDARPVACKLSSTVPKISAGPNPSPNLSGENPRSSQYLRIVASSI